MIRRLNEGLGIPAEVPARVRNALIKGALGKFAVST